MLIFDNMQSFSLYKGIHPGLILERELRSRKWKKSHLAQQLGEFPQTLSAITKGIRPIPVGLALKIEQALGWDEGFLSILQVYYDIRQEKRKQSASIKPDLSQLRPGLFWDTKIENIDWVGQKRAVIERVFRLGTEQEKKLIRNFYGDEVVDRILNKSNTGEESK